MHAHVTHLFMLVYVLTMRTFPAMFLDQMKAACESSAIFGVFFWSWLIVGFFLLINIFICIIIDAYITAKNQIDSKMGMHEELAIMFNDWWSSFRCAFVCVCVCVCVCIRALYCAWLCICMRTLQDADRRVGRQAGRQIEACTSYCLIHCECCRMPSSQYMSDAALLKILKEKQMGLPSTYQLREVSICVFACVVRRPIGAARRIFSYSAEVEISRLGGIFQTAGKDIQNDRCSVKLASVPKGVLHLLEGGYPGLGHPPSPGVALCRRVPARRGIVASAGYGAHCAMDVDFAGVLA